jgi:hypothetical protein
MKMEPKSEQINKPNCMNKLITLVKKFLFIGLVIVSTITAWSQGTFKNGIKQGVIKVKFTPEMTTSLSQVTVAARTSGFTTGIQSIDNAAQATKASNMYRLFPYDAKHESKLRKHGLHLWYVVEIDATVDPKTAITQFKQLSEVAVAELEHEKIIAPYEVKAYVPTAGTYEALPFNDPLLKDQWHYNNSGQVGVGDADVNLFEAWQSNTGSNSIIVSVHDQGVDVNHADLKANIWVNQAEKNGQPGVDDDGNGYVDDINGYNFQKNNGAIDPENHGTHVAGTIAAVNNNGIGVSGVAGGNGSGNGVKIMSLQILGGAPIEKSFVYAANNGAVVSQNSWGYSSPYYFDQSVLDAIDYFIEEAGNYDGSPMKGGLVLFAAGNNDYDAEWYPGYYPSTMTVASIGPEWKKASYSNFGTWVEISAPGGASSTYGPTAGVLSTIPKDQYAYMQGTSMACPHMSGIAALALSNRNHQMTNTELWNKLVTGVVNIDKQNPNYIGKLGSGAVDAVKAIKNDQGIAPVAITNVTATDVAQEFAILTWTVPTDADDAQPLTFNIYYGIDTVTAANLVAASKVTFKNDSLAGKTIVHEVGNLLGLRQYDFVVTSVDRWGNESVISNVLEITTNDGPAIAVTPTIIGASNLTNPPGTYTWIIDAAISKTGTQNLTIQNNAAGLLRYSSFMRPRVPIASPTSFGEEVIYPVIPSASSSSSEIGRAGVEEDNVVKLYSNEPQANAYTTITKKLISGSATNLIGETDTTLPNSAAAKFSVTEAGGFNLTRVTMTMKLTRAATVAEPVVVEIYKGGLAKENRLLAQAYTTTSLVQHNASITLNEQLYFAQGESFYVVFHIPTGNLFPLGMGFDADPNLATEGYYSSNVGTTWQVFDDAINDKRFAWAMETFSGNADIGTYLSLAPASGDISGMNSSIAVITADANNLINGNYVANLIIPSNDGAIPELRVPVYLQVKNHQPKVKMIDVVDYSTAFIGSKKSFDIVMDNQGYGRISSMTAAGSYVLSGPGASQFIVENSSPVFRPSAIPARDQAVVRVTYAPNTAGPANATLTITGRSGTNVLYTYTVSLFGVGAETSKIALTPESQVKTPLTIGQTVSADITVQNIGGFPLKYFIPGYDTKGVSDNWPTSYQKYGYKLRTSYVTDPNPITNQFVDIKTTGVDITSQILTDKTWATIDMGFDFPYYNKVMKTIYVAQKGFTAFDNALRPLNTPTLNRPGTTPKGVISLLGTFLTYAAQGKVYYQKEADRLIIQYDNVTDGSGASLTAQMVLFSNGDIRFYYNNMTAWPTNKRQYLNILVEDYDQKDGILIHDYTKLLTLNNGTAIGLDYPGPNIITSITNGSGILAPGTSATVTVNMNTATLVEGLLNRSINFISNDPINGQKSALIQLDITSGGTASPSVSTDNIAFGNVFQGAVRSQQFTIKNNGTANVNVTSMTFTNGAFNLSASSEVAPLSVKSGYYKNFTVEIPTGTVASLTDDLVITYADASTYTIHVTGNVIDAPAIIADLTAVNQTLNYKETASVPYSIQNTGAAPLEISITGKQWATFDATGSTPTAVTYDVEKLNNGSVYQWIDIRKTGVHVDLSGDVFTPEDYWNEIDLPFPFEFYGTTYNKIKLGLNGVASFEVAPPVMIFSDSVPSKNYEGAYLMPYWSFSGFSDFYPLEDFGIFYQTYDDKIIITWSYMVNNFGGMGNPMSTQMFLYKNGTIKFQYRVEDTGNGGDFTSQFTFIGLQRNSTDGIMISPKIALDYGTNTGLAYILTPEKKHVVASGATLSGDINFNSFNVYGGVYNANLKIKSNAPNNELKLKPVQLTVNGTPVYVAPDSVNYGLLMIGNPTFNQKYFEIENTGSAPLVITNMRRQVGNAQRMNIAAWQYVYNPFPPVGYNWQFADITGLYCTGCANAPITVGANETLRMMVEHNPNNAQNYNEGLIITSNEGIDTIRLTSTAYRAPGLVVTTTPINETMNTLAEVVERKIPFSATNTNNGQGNLEYSVAIEFGRVEPSSSSAETMAVTNSSTQSLSKNVASNGGTSTSSTNSYNRTIKHTDKVVPDTWVGTGGSSPFVAATKYNAGPSGFSISHVETFFRAQSLTTGKVLVEIRAGGTSIATSSKVAEGSYTFTASGGDEYGSWITIPMDKVGGVYPNEDFYVVVTSPLGIQLPQGTITDETTTGGRYYYYDYNDSQWYDINTFQGYEVLGWLMTAAEETAGVTSWLNITSALNGSNAPGVKDTVRLTIDSHFAMRGDQIANIVLTTNDPLKKVTKIPVSLHVNEAPIFNNVETVYIAEGEVQIVNITVTDKESNTFTVVPSQTYAGMTSTYAAGQLAITLSPGYGTAGNKAYAFTATDEHDASREMTLSVVVSHTNRAPQYVGTADAMNYTANSDLIEYAISTLFTDPDGDSYTYTVTSANIAIAQVYISSDKFLIKPTSAGETELTFVVTDSHGAVTTHTKQVTVSPVLGIEDNDVNFSLTAYPNPSRGKVYLHVEGEISKEYSIRIISSMGVTVMTSNVTIQQQDAEIDLSSLQKGIYFIEITDNKGRSTRRVVKQ